jgi:hypothetical protein
MYLAMGGLNAGLPMDFRWPKACTPATKYR